MIKVGIIGYRGMVGSVLLSRLFTQENKVPCQISLFSTTQAGQSAPDLEQVDPIIHDAANLNTLAQCDVLICCQGSDYTKQVHGPLREISWQGFWVDAASALRMAPESTLVLDPINAKQIDQAIAEGKRDFIGSNCTVSLMLLAIQGLLSADCIEWISAMTYQAISGAGAKAMQELIKEMKLLGDLSNQNLTALELAKQSHDLLHNKSQAPSPIAAPLAGNLLPWIDSDVSHGISREEQKAPDEASKLLGYPLAIDGLCVRIGTLRSHSQALTIGLKHNMELNEIEHCISQASPFVHLIPNTPEASVTELTPLAVSDTLNIHVGRVRHLHQQKDRISLFTVGDQLLWGAAEPLCRVLKPICAHLKMTQKTRA